MNNASDNMTTNFTHNSDKSIVNPRKRVVDDLQCRNKDNMTVIAGEYYGSMFTYAETFQMFQDYKKAFLSIDGIGGNAITISAPSTIASVNAFYGAIDANKIANMVGPGFLHAFPEKYTRDLDSKTLVVYDGFLTDDLIVRLRNAGIQNIIVTSITDYMNPAVREYGIKCGTLPSEDYLDSYVRRNGHTPLGIDFIRLMDFAELGRSVYEDYIFPYQEKQIAAYFLTGATTSQFPKCVKLYADGLTKMARIYDNLWFDFEPGDRNTVFIPIFYATGAVHGIHAGLFDGMTLIYKPKYDRFAFAKDLSDSKCKLTIVAPSHVATLCDSELPNQALSHLKYIFIGGEAIVPAQMEKFRQAAKRLGIQYILNGYGMTETGSMSGVSDKLTENASDVTVSPVPGVMYRIVDAVTNEVLPDNKRGILEKYSPCALAGYTDVEKDKALFTDDGWIHTGDIAIRYNNGKYRVFGRSTDCFCNDGNTYYMFDIEEMVLKNPGIAEAEVTKICIDGIERPIIVIVPQKDWQSRLIEILRAMYSIEAPGMKYLLGVSFISQFKTNPITSKRDVYGLPNEIKFVYALDEGATHVIKRDVNGKQTRINSNEMTLV